MKTIPVNFIGYGDWGSRLVKKVQDEGFVIENLVTNRTDVEVDCNNLVPRDEMNNIDWTLPTFIITGPLYHHEILRKCQCRAFVEKPYYLPGQLRNDLVFKPYVNYQWYNSLKLRMIKDFIGYGWKTLEIELFTTTTVERGFSVLEDFLPHVVSIAAFLNPNYIQSSKIIQNNGHYQVDFNYESHNITFRFGRARRRYARFQTEDHIIETSNPNKIVADGAEYDIIRDPLKDSIVRYYNYYLHGTCDRIFYSEDFHTFVMERL